MSTKDEKLLKLARERFDLANTATNDQRTREREAIGFYNGKQWSQELIDARKGQTVGSGSNQQTTPARPSLVINKTREPVRQVLNQERQSDLSIELVPADDFAGFGEPIDQDEIDLREGFLRRIQRDQECDDARSWAFNRAVIAGKGYRVVMTRYVPGKSQDQEVYIERIYDQNSVLLDPSHEQPDGSDAEWGFYGKDMLLSAFIGEYGAQSELSADMSDDQWRTLGEQAPKWFTGDGDQKSLRVMNYYYTEHDPQEIYHLKDGRGVTDAEAEKLPDSAFMLDDAGKRLCHTDDVKTVQWCKITGTEILDSTEWPSRWLPIIEEVGEELQPHEGERFSEGVVQPMMDACKGNNYIVSKFVERVGLAPLPSWMIASGGDEGYGDEYDAANTRTIGRLHYNLTDDGGQALPPPFKVDVRSEVADIATGVQIFGQAIAATSVVPQTALGHVDPTVKSGKLAQALITQGQQGTSNFMDNHLRSMRHEMRVVNDLLYPIYGRPGRLARIVNKQGEHESVIIGQPFTYQGEGAKKRPVPVNGSQPASPAAPPQTGQPPAPPPAQPKTMKLTKDADFNVALTVKRKAETRNQEIAEILGGVISADPQQMSIIGDLFWKVMDIPEHEKLAERYKAVLDPRVLAVINGQQAPDPKVQAQLQAMNEQMQKLQQQADANLAKVTIAAHSDASKERTAALDRNAEDARAAMDREVKLAVAELGAKVDRIALFLDERARVGAQAQETGLKAMDQLHDHAMADQGQQAALQQGNQQHQQSLEQGDQSHQQALETQQQAADLAPEPQGPTNG